MKGSYVLLIEVDKVKRIKIGRLGNKEFRPGFYAYVGSAMSGLEGRIKRHLSSIKKVFWHIDYLLKDAEVVEVFQLESDKRIECEIAVRLSKRLPGIRGFGCSDCRCPSHLFFSAGRQELEKYILDAMKKQAA
jgi:Uri superfamily endonuclease